MIHYRSNCNPARIAEKDTELWIWPETPVLPRRAICRDAGVVVVAVVAAFAVLNAAGTLRAVECVCAGETGGCCRYVLLLLQLLTLYTSGEIWVLLSSLLVVRSWPGIDVEADD